MAPPGPPAGLDSHYLVQLQLLCQQSMWTKLNQQFLLLSQQTEEEEERCLVFLSAMDHIFR